MKVLVRLLILVSLAAAGFSACGTPRPPKIVVIGLDGLTWKFLDPLLSAHQLPNLEGVIRGAATGELETFRPTHSGILWTSIATGKTMEKHGITDWTFVDQNAREEIERLRLVTGTRRTAATIWEILSEKGRKVEVVNWWVTYPARPLNGVLISDRLRAVMNKKSVPDEPDVVYPPEIIDELKPLFVGLRGANKTLSTFGFPLFNPTRANEMFATSKVSRGLFGSLISYVGQDQMVTNWALHLFKKGQPDFFGVVLRLTDVYAHFAWRFADRETLERLVPQVGVERLMSDSVSVRGTAEGLVKELDSAVAKAMLPSYKFADAFVGSIVSAMDPDSILVIVSDHGFTWSGGSYDHNPSGHSAGEYPRKSPPGVIILKGPGIRPGRIEGARLFDVVPTILYAEREPVAQDMDGRALTEAFRQPFLFGKREERFVRTYGTGARQTASSSPSSAGEKEILEDLRGLGYIDAGPSAEPKEKDEEAESKTSSQKKTDPASKSRRHGSRRPKRKP